MALKPPSTARLHEYHIQMYPECNRHLCCCVLDLHIDGHRGHTPQYLKTRSLSNDLRQLDNGPYRMLCAVYQWWQAVMSEHPMEHGVLVRGSAVDCPGICMWSPLAMWRRGTDST